MAAERLRVHARGARVLSLVLLATCSGPREPVGPSGALKVDVDAGPVDATMTIRTPTAPPGERGGSVLQLNAKVTNPQDHELENKRHIEWRSSNPAKATVDETGLVTAQDTGRVTIVVDHKKSIDSVRILIIPVPVRSVTIAGADSIGVDDTAQYVATARDEAGEPLLGRAITFASTDDGIVTVSPTGEVVGIASGSTTVRAESEGVTGTHELRVWPQPVATVTILAPIQNFPLYREPTLSVTVLDRRDKVLVDRAVTWSSLNQAVATISANGTLTSTAPGTVDIVAESEGKADTVTLTIGSPVEARALWVNRFDYTSAAHIVTIFQRAASANFNIVYFQVRTAGDALYTPRPGSPIEPCSPRLCGTLGGAAQPYDPLDVALREAARYGIQVHAWLNALTGWTAGSAAACNTLVDGGTPRHVLFAHPEYKMSTSAGVQQPCLTSSEYVWLSPGFAEVRWKLAAVSADLARRYGVDRPEASGKLKGIHLDRIRYPGVAWSYDTASVNSYRRFYNNPTKATSGTDWNNYRRGLVNAAVKETWDSIQTVAPSVVLSAAVWGTYSTFSAWTGAPFYTKGFDDLLQDPRTWVGGGYLDVAAPMTYPGSATSTTHTIAGTPTPAVTSSDCAYLSYECELVDHQQGIEGRAVNPRHMYIGVTAIKGSAEMLAQIDIARRRRVSGVAVYSYSLVNGFGGFTLLRDGKFRYPATIPAMGWK